MSELNDYLDRLRNRAKEFGRRSLTAQYAADEYLRRTNSERIGELQSQLDVQQSQNLRLQRQLQEETAKAARMERLAQDRGVEIDVLQEQVEGLEKLLTEQKPVRRAPSKVAAKKPSKKASSQVASKSAAKKTPVKPPSTGGARKRGRVK